MKPVKSKKQQRREMAAQMRAYLAHGGEVNEVPRGISGREGVNAPLPHVFDKKAEPDTRTSVNEAIAAIDRRRKTKPAPSARHGKQSSKPRKKMIYDDFGEPLRWEWQD